MCFFYTRVNLTPATDKYQVWWLGIKSDFFGILGFVIPGVDWTKVINIQKILSISGRRFKSFENLP